MLFWIGVANTLLFSFTMIGFGLLFLKHPPKEINSLYGYRTRFSSINQDTWVFAHHFAGKVWVISGVALLVIALPVLYILRNWQHFENFVTVFILAELIPVVFVIWPTERALRKTFTEDGRRKE